MKSLGIWDHLGRSQDCISAKKLHTRHTIWCALFCSNSSHTKEEVQLLRLVLLIAVCLVAEVLCAETISPNDPRVNLSGRWSVENSTSPWCAWQGSSFTTEIIGTNLSAVFSSRAEEYVRVIVDGDDQSSTKLRIKKGTHKQVLVSGLNDGRHRVQVVKETYLGRGRLTLRQLESEGRF